MLMEDMNISGVEFKSMPSGLHNVSDDLMYFSEVLGLRVDTSLCRRTRESARTTEKTLQTRNAMPEWSQLAYLSLRQAVMED